MYVNNIEKQENVGMGVLGAVLFSIAGGALWVLLDRVGFLAGISGYVAFLCATKGYAIFAGKQSKKGIIISVIASIVMMLIAAYVCLAWEVFDAFREMGTSVAFLDCLKYSYEFLADGEVAGSFFLNLLIGLVLCVVASYRDVITAFKTADDSVEQPADVPAVPTEPTDPIDPPVESNLN